MLLEKPDPSNGNQLRLDKAWGVLYAEEFPQGDLDLKPDTTILYTNEKSWRKDQGVEMEYCYKINELDTSKSFEGCRKRFRKVGFRTIIEGAQYWP